MPTITRQISTIAPTVTSSSNSAKAPNPMMSWLSMREPPPCTGFDNSCGSRTTRSRLRAQAGINPRYNGAAPLIKRFKRRRAPFTGVSPSLRDHRARQRRHLLRQRAEKEMAAGAPPKTPAKFVLGQSVMPAYEAVLGDFGRFFGRAGLPLAGLVAAALLVVVVQPYAL